MGKGWGVMAAVLLAAVFIWPRQGLCAEAQGITGPELAKILQDAGYRAKLETGADGDPVVRTGMAGLDVVVLFYDCEAQRCSSLQLSTGLDLPRGTTLDVINRFNHDYRYVRAFLDEEDDPFLRLDFEVTHTEHAAYVASQVDTFEQLLAEFRKAVGFDTEEAG
jgi:hypothetical protein